MKKLFIILCILLIAGGSYFFLKSRMSGKEVQIVSPELGTAVEVIYATGIVEPVYWSKLSAPAGGRVVEILKDEGDKVKKDDVIARLDDREQHAEIDRLSSNLRQLKKEVDRQKALSILNFASRKIYEETISNYESAKAMLDAAQKRLSDMKIVAPMDGEVLKKTIEAGEFIKSGDPIFWVGMPEPLQIIAEVDEEDIPKVFVGQRTLIKTDAYANQVIEGKISKIIPKGDPVNKIFLAEVALPKNSGLFIGMTTEVNMIAQQKENALLLPTAAVLENKVWLMENGRAIEREVGVGIVGDKKTEILKGLKQEDKVITPFPQNIKESSRAKAAAVK